MLPCAFHDFVLIVEKNISALTTCDCDFPWCFALKGASPLLGVLSLRCDGMALCAAAIL